MKTQPGWPAFGLIMIYVGVLLLALLHWEIKNGATSTVENKDGSTLFLTYLFDPEYQQEFPGRPYVESLDELEDFALDAPVLVHQAPQNDSLSSEASVPENFELESMELIRHLESQNFYGLESDSESDITPIRTLARPSMMVNNSPLSETCMGPVIAHSRISMFTILRDRFNNLRYYAETLFDGNALLHRIVNSEIVNYLRQADKAFAEHFTSKIDENDAAPTNANSDDFKTEYEPVESNSCEFEMEYEKPVRQIRLLESFGCVPLEHIPQSLFPNVVNEVLY